MLNKRITRVAAGIFALAIAMSGAGRAAPQTDKSDRIHLASGQKIVLELQTPLNTTTAREGDRVIFVTVREIVVSGKTAIPKGSQIGGTVLHVKSARNSKRAEVEFRIDALVFDDGTKLPVNTSTINVKSDDKGSNGPGVINGLQRGVGQAVQGAALGALFGGRQGAMLGAALGAGAEAAGQMMSRSRQSGAELDLGQGSIYEVKLSKAIDIPARLANLPTAVAGSAGAQPSTPRTPGSEITAAGAVETTQPDQSNDQLQPIFIGEIGGGDSTQPTILASNSTPNGGGPEIIPPRPVFIESPSAAVPIIPVQTDEPNAIAVPAARVPGDALPANELPAFRISVNVNLAQIDAVVRDRGGRPMDNLRITDFRLFEDGVERPIQTFSKDELPLAIALVIDRSGSVASFMDRIQTAAYQALSQLKAGDSACLFAFAGRVEMIEGLTTNLQRVANQIGALRAEGGTDIPVAIHAALDYLARTAPERRRAVILISDNQQATGNMAVSVNQTIQTALRNETVVYSVKMDGGGGGSPFPLILPGIAMPIPTGPAGNPVPEIAQETGGEVFEVSRSGSIDKALASVIGRLKVRYTLGYNTSSDRDGFRPIEVRLVERFGRPKSDYTILARSGQYDLTPQNTNRRR